jgi:DNA-binding MarR family transcriptional regulator
MIDASDFSDCKNCLCLEARRGAQRLTRAYDKWLRPHGLTINQFSMLSTLILAGPQTMAELAERLGVDRTTLVRNVGLSEQHGLVKSGKEPKGRRLIVELTKQGRAAAAAALPAWRAAQEESLQG